MNTMSQSPGENADNNDLEMLKFSRMETLIQNFGVRGIVPLSVVASVILAIIITFGLNLFGIAVLYSVTVGITIAIASPVSYFASRLAFRSLELKELALRYEQESRDAKENLEQIKRLILGALRATKFKLSKVIGKRWLFSMSARAKRS